MSEPWSIKELSAGARRSLKENHPALVDAFKMLETELKGTKWTFECDYVGLEKGYQEEIRLFGGSIFNRVQSIGHCVQNYFPKDPLRKEAFLEQVHKHKIVLERVPTSSWEYNDVKTRIDGNFICI